MSRILTGIHGRQVGVDDKGMLLALNGLVSGENGYQVYAPSADRVVLHQEFNEAAVPTSLTFVEGTDAATSGVALGVQPGGSIVFTTGDVTGVTAGNVLANVEEMVSSLIWRPRNGLMTMLVRFRPASIATGYFFIGFTDSLSAELPIEASGTGDGITTNATNAVGFLYDARMTTKTWWLVGVAADVDATAQNSGIAPIATKSQTLSLELWGPTPLVDVNAKAKFFINGRSVGSVMENAVANMAAGGLLTPVVAVSKAAADTTLITADLELLHVTMERGADSDS